MGFLFVFLCVYVCVCVVLCGFFFVVCCIVCVGVVDKLFDCEIIISTFFFVFFVFVLCVGCGVYWLGTTATIIARAPARAQARYLPLGSSTASLPPQPHTTSTILHDVSCSHKQH